MDFYFVDERGNDAINFEMINGAGVLEKYSIASKYFQVGVLKLSKDDLLNCQAHFNAIRYFLNLNKELERLVTHQKSFYKLWDIIENMHESPTCNSFSCYIEKESYTGPYLFQQESHKFRILSICRSLSYSMKAFKTNGSNKAQVIIDRFAMTRDNEKNAHEYLNRILKRYYKEVEIAFIDSRCCDYLQIIDVIMTVMDEKVLCQNSKFSRYNNDFLLFSDFTNFPK